MKKFFYVVVLLAMSLMMVSCGNKNKSGGGSSNVNLNSYTAQSVSGIVDLNNPLYFAADNGQFRIVDQQGAMNNAFIQAQQNGTIVQGITRYRVQLVGIFTSGQQQMGYYNPNPGMNVPSVQVSTAVFTRL